MYNCKKATELLDKSETENISLLTKIRLKIHLMMCRTCAIYKEQSLLLSSWIKKNPSQNTDNIKLSEDSKQKIITFLKKSKDNL